MNLLDIFSPYLGETIKDYCTRKIRESENRIRTLQAVLRVEPLIRKLPEVGDLPGLLGGMATDDYDLALDRLRSFLRRWPDHPDEVREILEVFCGGADPGPRVWLWTGDVVLLKWWGDRAIPQTLNNTKATVLSVKRKLVTVRAHEDAYGTRTIDPDRHVHSVERDGKWVPFNK